MSERFKNIIILFVIAIGFAFLAYIDPQPAKKSHKLSKAEQEDIEAACIILTMTVY